MKFHKATIKNIEKIKEIYSEGILKEFTLQYPKYSNKKIKEKIEYEIREYNKTIRKNLNDKKQCWGTLVEKGEIIGFGSAYIKEKNKGVIESVYIEKSSHRKGYGKEILKHLIKWLKSKKVKAIESNFLTENKPSLKLHEGLGFKPYLLRVRLE